MEEYWEVSIVYCMHLCAFVGNEMYTPFLLGVHAGALYIMGCLHHWCCKGTIISLTIAVSFPKLRVSLVSLVVELKPWDSLISIGSNNLPTMWKTKPYELLNVLSMLCHIIVISCHVDHIGRLLFAILLTEIPKIKFHFLKVTANKRRSDCWCINIDIWISN